MPSYDGTKKKVPEYDESMKDFMKDSAKEFMKERNGKSESELYRELSEKAFQAKREGTLSNAQIDDFVRKVSPILSEEQRAKLKALSEELKKI